MGYAVAEERRNRQTGTVIQLIDNRDGSFDTCDLKWVTLCDDHGGYATHETRAIAREWMAEPLVWCSGCQDAEAAKVARPVILVDVDDVLNWRARRGHNPPYCGCAAHRGWVRRNVISGDYRVTVNPANGAKLLRLAGDTGAELMWFTYWNGDANTGIAPLHGLPELPVAPVDVNAMKVDSLVAWAAECGRPFVVIDDEPFAEYVTPGEITQPWHGVGVDPYTALTDGNIAEAAAWLASLKEGVK